jgi:hypothetical protein
MNGTARGRRPDHLTGLTCWDVSAFVIEMLRPAALNVFAANWWFSVHGGVPVER